MAAPPESGASPLDARSAAALSPAGKPVTITLITGDKVSYSVDRSGRGSATLMPAADRQGVSFDVHADKTGYYVIPNDVAEQVSAGLLDRQLFDVKYLAENGYADSVSKQIPLIVQYARGTSAATAAAKAKTLPGRARSFGLGSVHGAAVGIDKARANGFWKAVHGSAASAPTPSAPGRAAKKPSLGVGLAKVWLDAKVKASDDVSNAQIGAPAAWAAGFDGTGVNVGIIDTGIDAAHPDLAGKVVASRSFVPGSDPDNVTDGHGHGTHVASIITGSGAASDGKYKGVAGGVHLTIAKALNDQGRGDDSEIIAAMEWQAATQHSKIVSMSLGGGPSDGTDPLSQAVNDLTAQYGTLFVMAAGNAGRDGPSTIAAGGAASAALTVGAVDSADKMADFSSRGPRLGTDYELKPEISAPGVGIVAARAKGTLLGSDLGEYYTGASGTSMATPHVSAAAAMVLQEHPDWTNEQIKNALVGSTKDLGFSPYDQGAGRLDVARAVSQQVFAETTKVSAVFTDPYTEQLKRPITYRNFGTSPVTLNVAPKLASGGAPAPSGMLQLDTQSVTVPAGGTASVELTVDPTLGEPGAYTGSVVATSAAGDRVAVPLSFRKSVKMQPLHVRVVAGGKLRGPTFFGLSALSAVLMNDDNPKFRSEPSLLFTPNWAETDEPGTYEATLMLPEDGVFAVQVAAESYDVSGSDRTHHALLINPQVTMDAEKTVTFRGDELVPLKVETPRPSDSVRANYKWQRTSARGTWYYDSLGLTQFYPQAVHDMMWVSPTEKKAAVGSFWFNADQIRGESQLTASLASAGHLELHPHYITDDNAVPKFTGDKQVAVVSEADLRAGRDVRGKLVLADPLPYLGPNHPSRQKFWSLLDLAAAGGAAGIVGDSGYTWRIPMNDWASVVRVPLLWIGPDEATQARQMLAQPGGLRADLHAAPSASYEYKLSYYLDRIGPDTMTIKPDEKSLAQVDATYHSQYTLPDTFGPANTASEANHTFAPDQYFSVKAGHLFPSQVRRTEYYNTAPDVVWQRDYLFGTLLHPDGLGTTTRVYAKPTIEQEDWNGAMIPDQARPDPGVINPTRFSGYPCDGCRQGDIVRVRSLAPIFGQYGFASDSALRAPQSFRYAEETHLWRNVEEIQPQHDAFGFAYYQLPADEATYRVTNTFKPNVAAPHAGSEVDTTWTIKSKHVTENTVGDPHQCIDTLLTGNTDPCAWLPLIYLNYSLGLAPDNSVPAGSPFKFTVKSAGGQGAVAPAGIRVWTSPDGGKTWTEASVTPGPNGTFQVGTTSPASASAGAMSLKVSAWDNAGDTVDQVIKDAYVLK